jgi:hypothetical protein
MPHELLRFGDRVTALPIIHGSGDFALEVRRVMLDNAFDCVAVPLPPSFQADVEQAIQRLPTPTLVAQPEEARFRTLWTPESLCSEEDDEEAGDDDARGVSYVPVDPCQGVITAVRVAMGEHLPRKFIDLETSRFLAYTAVLPDPYVLKKVPIERFAAALLPCLERLPPGQPRDRAVHMAARLRQLEQRYRSILFVCSILDWPWIREAYAERAPVSAEDDEVQPTDIYQVDPRTLLFLFGELPYITGLYERARADLESDENLSIDGVKELLLAARGAYLAEFKGRARRITPHLLSQCLKYIRNLSLIERRMTPDLYSIVIAAKQIFGDQYAIHVAETARQYPYASETELDRIRLGIERAELADGEVVRLVSRLPGPPVSWRSCRLQRRPEREEIRRWRMKWNPFSHCSWPPEDERIEDFRTHVFDRARAVLGADLARSEKFTTSVMDGVDIRETLRHWYDGDIYVKVLPPSRGNLDCAVMLFDSPADPRDYPWRTTWYAEHDEESTLAFFATDFRQEMIGPGICVATYGGALFLFPPVAIADVWDDRRLDFAETLEERLLAAACMHSQSRHIALLSPLPPGAGWRRLAKRFQKKWVHLPLSHFSDSTIQQLRMVHVLNGKHVRSYAADFIKRA